MSNQGFSPEEFNNIFQQAFGNNPAASCTPNQTQEEQARSVQNIKKALDLQLAINSYRERLSLLRSQKFKDPPAPPQKPVKESVPNPTYPPVQSRLTLWEYYKTAVPIWVWILSFFVLWGFGHIVLAIIKYKDYKQAKLDDADRIRNSAEYRAQCDAIENATAVRRAKAETVYADRLAAYDRALYEYNTVALPKYQQEKNAWEKQQHEEIANLERKVEECRRELDAHYNATKVVPMQYRKTSALRYLYDLMSTSNYTITQAIANYEQKLQRDLEAERLRAQQAAYEQQRRTAEAAEEAAWAAEQAAYRDRSQAAPDDGKKDYYWSSDCIQRRNLRNGKYKVIRKCEGCRMAPFCSRYK